MLRLHAIAIICCIASIIPSMAATVNAAVRYTVRDLGSPGFSFDARGINDSGQIVGSFLLTHDDPYGRAFLYSGGVIQDLGTLGGMHSSANGINAMGQITGYAECDDGAGAFVYSSGVMQSLGIPASNGSSINDSGQIAGSAYFGGAQHAFLYSNGVIQDLGTLGGLYSEGRGINASGQVTGGSVTAGNHAIHAFLYSQGMMQDLGSLGDHTSYSRGTDINSSGQVTGYSELTRDGAEHAFLYSNGVMRDLGTLGGMSSEGLGINDTGQIVGWAGTNTSSSHAFLYRDGVMQDLHDLIDPASGWTLEVASAISNNGLITGVGQSPSGRQRLFLLTPIPEPSGFLTLGGLSTLALLRKMRRGRTRILDPKMGPSGHH